MVYWRSGEKSSGTSPLYVPSQLQVLGLCIALADSNELKLANARK